VQTHDCNPGEPGAEDKRDHEHYPREHFPSLRHRACRREYNNSPPLIELGVQPLEISYETLCLHTTPSILQDRRKDRQEPTRVYLRSARIVHSPNVGYLLLDIGQRFHELGQTKRRLIQLIACLWDLSGQRCVSAEVVSLQEREYEQTTGRSAK
jgi:hypothetical protein